MSLLKVNNLKLGYEGRVIVSDLSFQVNRGDYLCIVGENGSGKTTLIKGLLGLINKYKGTVEYSDGLCRNHIGYLSQNLSINKDFPASVSEIVMSGFLNNKHLGLFYTKSQRTQAARIMEQVGIAELSKSNFCELSGGQQQKVLLARALCAAQKLILLDEPTSALDSRATQEFYGIVKQLNQSGMAVVMISHDINAAIRNASHILCLGSEGYFFGTTHQFIHSEFGANLIISDCPCEDCHAEIGKEVEENA